MTDADLCALVATSYTAAPSTTVAGDVRLVLTGDVLCIPGTRPGVLADWLRDLDVRTRHDPVLGDCHGGCLSGADAAMAWLIANRLTTEFPRVIVGHSLGGGIASLLAALSLVAGFPVDRLVTFGSMRSCKGPTVPSILGAVPGVHYWHELDEVPGLPSFYDHWRTPTRIGRPDLWLLADHAIAAYAAALAEIPAPAVPAILET